MLMVALSILALRFLNIDSNIISMRNNEDNPAKTFIFKGPNKIKIGTDGFYEGFYDIYAKQDIKTNNFNIKKGQSVKNVALLKDNIIESNQNINFELKRSIFSPLKFENGISILENTSGTFHIGKEINEGKCNITIETNFKNALFFIQILDKNFDEVESKTLTVNSSVNFKLKKGYYLNIHNMEPSEEKFVVKLIYN